MPKRLNSIIPEIYRKNFETISMFFWIEAQRNMLPTMTVINCIEKYFQYIGYDWGLETAINSYTRMKNEFLRNGTITEKNTGHSK